LSGDEQLITETLLDDSIREKMMNGSPTQTRYTFAKTRDALGRTLYRFVGMFDTQEQQVNSKGQLVHTHSLTSAKILIPNP